MAKGRPADPTRARRGTGNRPKPGEAKKARPAAPVEVAKIEKFPPPATLPEQVHDVWRAIVADLGGANNLRESYLPSLNAYCQAVYIHAQASANIVQYGILVKGANGSPMANPLIKTQKDAAATMLRFAESLGLTPAARIRLGLMEITGMSLLTTLNASLDARN